MTRDIAIKVAARYRQALVMPPRELVRYLGKFEAELKRATDHVIGSVQNLQKAVNKYPQGRDACEQLLAKLDRFRLEAVPRWLSRDLDDVLKELSDFLRPGGTQRRYPMTSPGNLSGPFMYSIDKALGEQGQVPWLVTITNPQDVARASRDPSFEWDPEHKTGVCPEFHAALAAVHEAASSLGLLLERTAKSIKAFATGDIQPEKFETLYHASVKARQIYQKGFDAEVPKDQLGLGGRQDTKTWGMKGISFTYDLKAALDIARSFKEAAMIAVGDIRASTILNWGVRESDLGSFEQWLQSKLNKYEEKQRVKIRYERSRWIVEQDDDEGNLVEKGIDQIIKDPLDVFRVYDAYLKSHPSRMDPLHLNAEALINFLKTADPKDIGVVSATVDMTHPEVSPHVGEREFRVPPAAVVKVTRLYQ